MHRIGRTGRAGRDGKAIMICTPRDERNFSNIEALIQKNIPQIVNPLPSKASTSSADEVQVTPKQKTNRIPLKPKIQKNEGAGDVQTDKETLKNVGIVSEKDTSISVEKTKNQTRSSSNENKASSNRGEHRNNNIVGLGDHTPNFIGLSFEERRVS